MKDDELARNVHASICSQCRSRGFAAPVDVLMDIGALTKQKHKDWRFGHIGYLEAACSLNLRELSLVMQEMRTYAEAHGLKPSFCCYKRWGVKKEFGRKRPVIPLRFSKSGDPMIERRYATHYVDGKRIAELKASGTIEPVTAKRLKETP